MHHLLITLIGALLMTKPAIADSYKGLEIPSYTVVSSSGDFELRRYQGHITAQVTVAGTRREAANRGFRVLANYIFGGNADGEKISMTAPVVQTPQADTGTWTVEFMMPSKFSLDSLPDAETSAIRFERLQTQTQLAFRFSGLASQTRLETATAKLRDYARDNNITLDGGPIYQFYDDPFTNPFRRRNEVAFVVN